MASKIFEEIGVTIQWRREGACRITVHVTTPGKQEYPGALARALVFEGTRIEVFYERVRKLVGPRRLPALLGHVLAHEIAHVLQGTDLHTQSGMMKAQWNNRDYDLMAWKPLSFTASDAQLIRMGLDYSRRP
jgi:hypothetical protein